MRIFFVSPYVPSPVRVRPYYWIKNLAALGHEIRLFTVVSGADDEAALDDIRRACGSVTIARMRPWRPAWNCARAIAGPEPLQLAWSRLPALSRAIRTAVGQQPADVAHIEHLRAACFAPVLRPLPIVYDAVDSISLLFEQTRVLGPRASDRWMAALDVRRTARFEATMLKRFDRVLVTSPVDAARILALSTGGAAERLVVLPTAVDLDYFQPATSPREPATLIFSGKMSYHANVAAARALVADIMPSVWRQRAEVRVLIVGQHPDRSVQRLARDARVTVTGQVPDLRPYLARATLAVCPIPYGVGMQNKVLEAMASGVPVVASRLAAQSLLATVGVDLSVAESADGFATEILRLLASPEARATLASRGRAYVEHQHAGPVLARRLEEVYRQVMRPVRSAR
jgi:glycosyltransferase involved in cell wall biosynthesis